MISLGLALPWLFADLGALADLRRPGDRVLLSSSALFCGLVLRSGEHPLVRLVLAPYRLCLAAATVAAVVAGGALAFHGLARDAGGHLGSRRPCGRPGGRVS